MQPYGKIKRIGKIHPHNECSICSEQKIVKARERRKNKKSNIIKDKTND